MSILEKVKKQMEKQANVMDGRTKGEIKELTAYLIKDFTILKDKNTGADYSAFIVEGNDEASIENIEEVIEILGGIIIDTEIGDTNELFSLDEIQNKLYN